MKMNPQDQHFLEHHQEITRRWFLGRIGLGIGGIAFSGMGQKLFADTSAEPSWLPGNSHFKPRARLVIAIHLAGSPPQQDLFDPKPLLKELDGQPCPDHLMANEIFPFIKGKILEVSFVLPCS